jgi:2-oxoglutarate dehydrogenase E1 component
MLRSTQYRSRVEEFTSGSFRRVLDDVAATKNAVTTVVMASGKVAVEALDARNERGANHVAIVRVEQLYPWPAADLDEIVATYPHVERIVWLQEEPENMGAWPFVHLQMHHEFRHMKVAHVARAESASPATGSGLVHATEQADLLNRALA